MPLCRMNHHGTSIQGRKYTYWNRFGANLNRFGANSVKVPFSAVRNPLSRWENSAPFAGSSDRQEAVDPRESHPLSRQWGGHWVAGSQLWRSTWKFAYITAQLGL